jgi:hypothetical protein
MNMDDSEKLAIREEVEQRFGNPQKTFTDLIESEVEKRINWRIKHYSWMILVIAAIITTFAGILGWQIKSNMDSYIDKQLSEKGIDAAMEQATNGASKILKIGSDAEACSEFLNTNFQPFIDRINEIKKTGQCCAGG